MKILFIVNARFPTEKAYGIQIAKTIEAFELKGHKVLLLAQKRNNDSNINLKDLYNIKAEVRIKRIKNYFFFLEKISEKLYFKLQRFTFIIFAFLKGIFFQGEMIISRDIVICFLLSLFGKRVIFEEHEPKQSRIWIYKYFLKKLKKKVIVAYGLAELYKSYGIDKNTFKIIPNGVDVEEFDRVKADKNIWRKEFGFDENEKVILYIGHFYKWKGVFTLLDSAKFLSEVKIVLIGGTEEDRGIVKKYISNNNLKNIVIKKFVPHKKVIEYMKSADVLVLPNTAKEERSEKYTTPLKMFEYMASGVPVVASRLKSFSRYLVDGKNAVLFEADNPKDFAEKINIILNNKETAKKISERALEDVKNYSWKKRVEEIIEFIK